jgi:hypothetical protein
MTKILTLLLAESAPAYAIVPGGLSAHGAGKFQAFFVALFIGILFVVRWLRRRKQ